MLTPDEVQWIGKKFDALEKCQAEMLQTLKHVSEKAHRVSEIEKHLFDFRMDMMELACEAANSRRWSEKPPTKSGWYFRKRGRCINICFVNTDEKGRWFVGLHKGSKGEYIPRTPVTFEGNIHQWWAGPIQEPEEMA